MKAEARVSRAALEGVPLTLTVTMSLGQWRRVKEQISASGGTADLWKVIYGTIQKIEDATEAFADADGPSP